MNCSKDDKNDKSKQRTNERKKSSLESKGKPASHEELVFSLYAPLTISSNPQKPF